MLQIHEVNLVIYPCTCKYMCIDNRLPVHKMISYFNIDIVLYNIWNENKTRILIITFYIPLQIYKHSFFSWFINEKKRHILTICMWYFENLYWLWFIHFLRITSVRLPWHSSLQVQKCPEMFVVGSIVKCKFNFFFFSFQVR